VLNPPVDRSDDDRVGGLPLTAWVQIVTVSLLMIGLFRFNLVRLWGKTNPIDGQDPNWQHSIFVPLIGIYYLFIHREELLRAAAMPRVRERAIRILAILGLALMAVAGAALLHKGEHGTPLLLVGILAAGLAVPAIVPTSGAFGSVLMLEGLLVFAYGIFPGQNDYVKDLGMVITLFGVATLLCGGNIDTHLLANVLVRDLVRQGRIARLRVAAQDQPGALAAITRQVFEAGANIIEVNHSRIFTRLPAKDTVIEVECEARDPESIDDVVSRLEAAGFTVERASLD